MNKARRLKLLKAKELLNDAAEIIETVHDEEQEAFDNLAESFQNGERGQKMQGMIDDLDSALSDVRGIDLEFLGN